MQSYLIGPYPAEQNQNATFPSVFKPVQMYNSINNNGFNGVIENIVDSDHQKLADLDLQCYQNKIYQGSAGQGVNSRNQDQTDRQLH